MSWTNLHSSRASLRLIRGGIASSPMQHPLSMCRSFPSWMKNWLFTIYSAISSPSPVVCALLAMPRPDVSFVLPHIMLLLAQGRGQLCAQVCDDADPFPALLPCSREVSISSTSPGRMLIKAPPNDTHLMRRRSPELRVGELRREWNS